jgi:hypothetical protein
MLQKQVVSNTSAVNEVIGGVLLLVIAVLAFSAIYNFIFPLPDLEVDSHVKLTGYVTNNGSVMLEHIGGEVLTAYRIDIRAENGTLLGSKKYTEEPYWLAIGETICPSSQRLLDEDDKLQVTVVRIDDEQQIIFDGILQGHTIYDSLVEEDENSPYLISSLLTDTTNEDLICFNKTSDGEPINLSFIATSTVFNWKVGEVPILNLLYSFDVNSFSSVYDYSENGHIGTVVGSTWSSSGKSGGAYEFTGDDFIVVPYCFDASTVGDLTIEIWMKTNQSDGTLLSFNRSDYCSLAVSNGKIRWSVTSGSDTEDIVGLIDVNDNIWHHVAVTYSQDEGRLSIFIDGVLDVSLKSFYSGSALGTGSQTSGYIGREKGISVTSGFHSIFVDDFETDKGWSVENDAGLTDGAWERGDPVNNGYGDPPDDYDGSGYCYVTDNGYYNSDVDDGETRLISPLFDFSSYESVQISYAVWYTNNEGYYNTNSDYFYVSISNNNGSSWTTVETIGPSTPIPVQWYEHSFQVEDYIALTSQMRIRFEASDLGRGSIVEAGVDAFEISGILSGGEGNFTGFIDDCRIYKRCLSEEQIYQDYLIGESGDSSISVLVSEETITGQTWVCDVTSINEDEQATTESSNQLSILSYGGG